MRVDVYETEGEALEAAAARAEAALAETPAPHPAVAIPGGRAGRALMLALASRVELPWERTRFCVVDEPIAAASNRLLLHKQLLVPRRIAGPPPTDGDRAGAWEAEVRAAAGPDLVFDVVLLDLGPQGEIGALDAASLAAAAGATVARTAERVGLGPVVLERARRVIVLATGSERAAAVARALRGDAAGPAALVLPGERVQWIVDRAAAAELLRDAQPAPA